MPATALNNLGLNYDWALGEDGWKTGMDLNMVLADWAAMPYLTVEAGTVTAQPGAPADGAAYLLLSAPTGADWLTALSGAANDLFIFYSGFPDIASVSSNGWIKLTPLDGWQVYDRATDSWWQFNGTIWVQQPGLPVVNEAGASVSLDQSHFGRLIRANLNGAQTFTVQDDADIDFPAGTRIKLYKAGTGVLTIAEDAANTIRKGSQTGDFAIPQHALVELVKESANEWRLSVLEWPFGYQELGDTLGDFTPALSDSTLVLAAAFDDVNDAFNVPADASVPYPIGHQLKVLNQSGGTVSVTADMAVTFKGTDPTAATFANGQVMVLEKVAADTWATLKISAA